MVLTFIKFSSTPGSIVKYSRTLANSLGRPGRGTAGGDRGRGGGRGGAESPRVHSHTLKVRLTQLTPHRNFLTTRPQSNDNDRPPQALVPPKSDAIGGQRHCWCFFEREINVFYVTEFL